MNLDRSLSPAGDGAAVSGSGPSANPARPASVRHSAKDYVFAGNARRWKYVRAAFLGTAVATGGLVAALAGVCLQPADLPDLALRPGAPVAHLAGVPARTTSAARLTPVVAHGRAVRTRLIRTVSRVRRRKGHLALPRHTAMLRIESGVL